MIMQTLGYLGPQGTFSHTAALHYADRHGYTTVCCSSFEEVMHKVASQELAYGIVPVENSLGGAVGDTLDLLTGTEGIWITAEFLLPVKQHLLTRPGVALTAITKVYSHPQALAQCRGFLQQHLSDAAVVETVSTAAAALTVAGAKTATVAAVGSESAAVAYGLEILQANIQDKGNNTTRFLVLGREKPVFSGEAKTSLVLALGDSPGALWRILSPLAQRGINLTRIESRPSGSRLGDYIFFIDLEGHTSNPVVGDVIRELENNTLWLKILGCYPIAASDMPSELLAEMHPLDLPGLRKEIDTLDADLIRLLTKRQQLVEQVAAFKSKDSVVDSNREEEVLHRVKSMACRSGIDPDIVEGIYRQIFKGSVRRQVQMLTLCN